MAPERVSQHAFLGVSALIFVLCAGLTIAWCAPMPMGAAPMCGGGAMSMPVPLAAWMPMPGPGWPRAAAAFLGMWDVMMAAMMLPSLVPMLWRYRRAVAGAGAAHLGRLTALAGVGYFLVWTVLGAGVLALGTALAAATMRLPALAEAASFATGPVLLTAGGLQLTHWKARRLACCREMPALGRVLPPDAGTALRHGVDLGVDCARSCANLMAILLAAGVMDLPPMVAMTAAVTAERLGPAGAHIARATGAVAIAAGLLLLVRLD